VADGPAADPGPHDRGSHGGHDDGHELLMAALLDRDLTHDDRAVAEGLLGTCSACAALHADLVALAAATIELPAEARPRDCRLTAADAARLELVRVRDGEPRGAASRLTGEMQVPSADHREHDQLLIASLLDRSSGGAERDRAEALIAACGDCAALHRDLLSLREAARALPTPPRPREFALSAEDARRFRRTGWRRLVAVFGTTRDAFSRPLAIGLTTIGLAGLLVATVPGVLPGATGSPAALPTVGQAVGGAGAGSQSLEGSKAAAAPSEAPSAAGPAAAALPAPTPAPTTAPAPVASAAPSGEAFDTFVGAPAASSGAAAVAPEPNASVQRDGADRTAASPIDAQTASSADRLAVVVLAGLLLAAGLALFALRWAGRRV